MPPLHRTRSRIRMETPLLGGESVTASRTPMRLAPYHTERQTLRDVSPCNTRYRGRRGRLGSYKTSCPSITELHTKKTERSQCGRRKAIRICLATRLCGKMGAQVNIAWTRWAPYHKGPTVKRDRLIDRGGKGRLRGRRS